MNTEIDPPIPQRTKRRYTKRKKKEETTAMGFRLPVSLVERLSKFGMAGRVCGAIAEEFIVVKEFDRDSLSDNHLIKGENGAVIYTTEIGEGLHHITIKKGSEILTIELTPEDIAHHVINLVEVLNTELKNRK